MIDSLAARPDPAARAAIANSLGSPNSAVRRAAIAALGRVGNSSSVPSHAPLGNSNGGRGTPRPRIRPHRIGRRRQNRHRCSGRTEAILRRHACRPAHHTRPTPGHGGQPRLVRGNGPSRTGGRPVPLSGRSPAPPAPPTFPPCSANWPARATPTFVPKRRAPLCRPSARLTIPPAARWPSSTPCGGRDRRRPHFPNRLAASSAASPGPRAAQIRPGRSGPARARHRRPRAGRMAGAIRLGAFGRRLSPRCAGAIHGLALRGLVRLAGEENAHPNAMLFDRYRKLLDGAHTDADLRLILGALGGVADPRRCRSFCRCWPTPASAPKPKSPSGRSLNPSKPSIPRAAKEAAPETPVQTVAPGHQWTREQEQTQRRRGSQRVHFLCVPPAFL